MTLLYLRPKGYSAARARAQEQFDASINQRTPKNIHDLVANEMRQCVQIVGKYTLSGDSRLGFELRPIQEKPGIYQLSQGARNEFIPELAFELMDAAYKAKQGKRPLIDRIEGFRIHSPQITEGQFEYMDTSTFAEMVRDMKTIKYADDADSRSLTTLKMRIECEDSSLLGEIIARHDHKNLGVFEKQGEKTKFDNGRIILGYDSWHDDAEKFTFMLVKERYDSLIRTHEPVSRKDWLCLLSVARIIDGQNYPGENPRYHIREFDAKFRV